MSPLVRNLRQALATLLTLGLILLAPGAQPFALAQISPDDDLRAAAADFERYTAALEASLVDLPRASFDPETVVLDEVGFEVDDLFAWVRDHTGLVPYRGALRGPRGVLMDRVGNSLDRSLLLYDLLSAVGEEVRLAHAELGEGEAQALFDALVVQAPDALPQTEARTDGFDRYAADGGFDAAELVAAATEDARIRADLTAELEARVVAQSTTLAELAGIAGGGDPSAAVAALRDHWWVQVSLGGEWTDLDTATTAPGESLASADRTEQPLGLSDLDAALLHTVTVRVVAECWDEGALSETTLLTSAPLVPADLLGADLFVRHVPVGWPDTAPEDFDVVGAAPERSLDAAADIEHWVPVLRVGRTSTVGLALSQTCEFPTAASLSWPGAAVSEAVGGATDLFNTLPTGGEEEEAETEEAAVLLSAEWLEYELQAPGAPSRTVRRQLFDRIGPAARAAGGVAPADDGLAWRLALLGQTDLLLQPHRLSDAYVEELLGRSILANRDALLTAAREAEIGPSDALTEALDSLSFLPGQLYALALARQADMAAAVYLAAPNILSYHSQMRRTDGGFATLQSFDIVSNEVEIHPSALADAGALRLQQGVRDTNAEALMARSQCQSVRLEGIGCEQRANAADRLAADTADWALVDSASALDALGLTVEPDGVREALDAGRIALVKIGGEAVWWQLDPSTGTVLGMGESGWGDAAVDYAIALWANVIGFATCAAGASDTVGRAACAAGVFLGWGAGVASLVGASVATKVLAVLAILLGALPTVIGAHSGD